MFRCPAVAAWLPRRGPPRSLTSSLRRAPVLTSSECHLSTTGADSHANPKPFESIPGPRRYPILGNFLQIAKIERQGRIHSMNVRAKMFDTYGPIYKMDLGIIGSPIVFTNDPNDAATMFRAEGKLPSRQLEMEKRMKFIHGKMDIPMFMFFEVGNNWKRLRTSMSKQILPRRVAMFTPSLYAAADEVITVLHGKANNSGFVEDVRGDLQKWALKGVTRFLFDIDLDAFSAEANTFAGEVCEASVHFLSSIGPILQSLPLYYLYKTKPFVQYEQAVRRMHRIGQQILQSKYDKIQEAIAAGDVDDTVKLSVIEQLLVDGTLTETEAISQMCDLVAAGVDTTSTTGSFVIHEVAKSPELQLALRDEVLKTVGADSEPSFEQLQSMTLVRNAVRETLRMHPVLDSIFRRTETDVVLSGYKVPAGTNIFFNISVTTADPDCFPEPEKFNPYRWTKGSQETNRFASIPFGFGPRMCYGRRLAELELHLLLTRLVQRYKMTTDQDHLKKGVISIIGSADPVRVKFEEW